MFKVSSRNFAAVRVCILVLVALQATPALRGARFVRGDADGSGVLLITDAIQVFGHLFLGSPGGLDCFDAADVDDRDGLNLTDGIYLLNFLFLGGPQPPAPYPGCGEDPTPDELSCAEYPACPGAPTARFTATPAAGEAPLTVVLDASSSTDPDGTIVRFEWDLGNGDVRSGERVEYTYLSAGNPVVRLTVTDDSGLTGKASRTIAVRGVSLPPDPSDVAPNIDPTVATHLFAASVFLYEGEAPIQEDVTPGTIQPHRVVVLRGRVADRNGAPLPAVSIRVLRHPEFGFTRSRADGLFDLVVNGGGAITVEYQKDGFLNAQRTTRPLDWQEWHWLPEVTLVPLDSQASVIDMVEAQWQVARGSPVTDGDGERQATLLFPPGTEASLLYSDGTSEVASSLTIRASEFTVGDTGPAAMPAELIPPVGYTYCVDLSADEAREAGARHVHFDRPIFLYLENFLSFPVGGLVPVGYYDEEEAVWVPSDNGRVIEVLSVTEGHADLDVDGSGSPAEEAELLELGVTAEERRKLADLYEADASLWRVPVTHFTTYDPNWGYGPTEGAEPPSLLDRILEFARRLRELLPADDNCEKEGGSTIEEQNQVLREEVEIAGSQFGLYYSSARVPGRRSASTLSFPVSEDTLPPGLRRIEVEIGVAGRRFFETLPAEAELRYSFTWDGFDAYGRRLQGTHPISVRIGYVYDGVYQSPREVARTFGQIGKGVPLEADVARQEFTLYQDWEDTVGPWDARAQGLGGWTVGIHHAYDPVARRLYLGDARSRASEVNDVIRTVAGGGTEQGDGGPATDARLIDPYAVSTAPDGSFYVADWTSVRRVGADGIISTVAGGGGANPGDGGPATEARLQAVVDVKVARDGSYYILEGRPRSRVRHVGIDGVIRTVAGVGAEGFSGDGGPADEARLNRPLGIALGVDGSLYVADQYNHRIRRVSVDGFIETVAGNGEARFAGDEGPAREASFSYPNAVAIGRDGSIFISSWHDDRIRRVSQDGLITTFAGGGDVPMRNGDGLLATEVNVHGPLGVTSARNGIVYVSTRGGPSLLAVTPDGTIRRLAGTRGFGCAGDDGPAQASELSWPRSVAIDPLDSLLIPTCLRIREVQSPLASFGGDEIEVASQDGQELYRFDPQGRHLATLSTRTGALLYTFGYDEAGLLVSIDADEGNVTTLERDAEGSPTAIVAPFGQRTELEVDADGFLASVTDPLLRSHRFTYGDGGLLEEAALPHGTSTYHYDEAGRLIRDLYPAGGSVELERLDEDSAFTVTSVSAEGVTRSYRVETLPTGQARLEIDLACCGQSAETIATGDASVQVTTADGTVTRSVDGPDPRFGMDAPVPTEETVTLPSGLTAVRSEARTATLADPGDPFSLEEETRTVTFNDRASLASYDAATRTWTHTSAESRQSSVSLDERGRVVEVTVADLEPYAVEYDERGRQAHVGHGASGVSFGYDEATGFLESITDPLGKVVTYARDALGRVTEMMLPDETRWSFEWDARGSVATLTEPGSALLHAFEHTPGDRLRSYRSPLGAVDRFDYDRDERLVRWQLPSDEEVEWVYGPNDQIKEVILPQGSHTYTYDEETGLLSAALSADGQRIAYEYDGGLLAASGWAGPASGRVAYEYDEDLRLAALTFEDRTFAVTHDAAGNLTGVGSLQIVLDAATGLLAKVVDGSFEVAYERDGRGRIQAVTARHGDRVVYSFDGTLDAMSRLRQKEEVVEGVATSWSYEYDETGQLLEVRRDGALVESYEYDDVGNRVGMTSATRALALAAADYEYDDDHKLRQAGDTRYEYDANGRLSRRIRAESITDYHYHADGTLAAVDLPGGGRLDYLYDDRQRCVERRRDGMTTHRWLYGEGLHPLAELDEAGELRTLYLYPDSVLPGAMIRAGEVYHVVKAHPSAPLLILDASGNTVKRVDHDAFGNVTADSSPAFDFHFGFSGGMADADTALVRFGVRDYQPETGRWTAKDPIFHLGGLNLYRYAGNDPVNRLDRLGLDERPHPRVPRHTASGFRDPYVTRNTYRIGPMKITRGKWTYYRWEYRVLRPTLLSPHEAVPEPCSYVPGIPEPPPEAGIRCSGGSCSFSIGEYVLTGVPEDFTGYTESNGTSP